MASAEIELQGHIIDSFILPRIWGAIEEAGAHFHVREMRIGQSDTEPSYARIKVSAASQQLLDDLIPELQRLGADLAVEQNVRTARVTQPGVLPDDFYSTTNLATQARVGGEWLPVADIEMDVAIVVDASAKMARAVRR